jgi:8-oxo-dGTP pyrophosphatase MutT (NUDIX family)
VTVLRTAEPPDWLAPLLAALPGVRGEQLSRFLPPAGAARHSAVLVLFGEGPEGPDVLLIERAHTMRSHAGQPAFPGGALDPEDGDPRTTGPVTAALREATEEVGLDPASVEVLGSLPALFLPPSGFVVHPVIAWWREPHEVGVVDEAEVAAVVRVPLSDLVDPGARVQVAHPSGWVGPAFEVADLLVWGFTAGLLDKLLALGGWEQPWDRSRVRTLDEEATALAARGATFPAGLPDPLAGLAPLGTATVPDQP